MTRALNSVGARGQSRANPPYHRVMVSSAPASDTGAKMIRYKMRDGRWITLTINELAFLIAITGEPVTVEVVS